MLGGTIPQPGLLSFVSPSLFKPKPPVRTLNLDPGSGFPGPVCFSFPCSHIVFNSLFRALLLCVSFTDLLVKDGPAQLVRAARAQDLTSTTLVTVSLMKLKRDIIISLLC